MPTHVITGAGSGIGAAVARRLHARGDELVLHARDAGRAKELAAAFPGAKTLVGDLADPDKLSWAFSHQTLPGHVDSLLHIAGVVDLGPVGELTPKAWRHQLNVNLIAPAELTRHFLPQLRLAQGHVVFVNSGAGLNAHADWSAYAASKHGLKALADSLRRTLAHHPLLTGRLERDADGGLSVVCNDAGAMFAVTHSDQVMPDYGPDRSAKQDLRRYIHSVNAFRVVGHDTPLLTVKVTHMRGGGSVLGVAVNHSVVDGSGYLDFLRHWSRTHAGHDGHAAPYDRALLDGLAGEARPAPDDPQYQVVTGRQKFGFIWRVNSRAWKVRTVTVRLTATEVLALRAAARAGQDRDLPPASSAVALGAHLWRVLGALRDRDPGAEERLGIVVGLRAVLKDRLPHGYGGNAVSNTTAVLPAREAGERNQHRATDRSLWAK